MTTSPAPSITAELLDELQQKAKAATPGPWGTWGEAFVAPLRARDGGEYSVVECVRTIAEVRGANSYANWKFIAAANPATILALVEHIRSLTERMENAEKDAWRYRWLRRHVGVLNDGYSTIWLPSSRTQIDANDEAETGAAIDAAIAQEADHE